MRELIDLLVPDRCGGCRGPVAAPDRPGLCQDCATTLGPPRPVVAGAGLPPVYALGRYHGPLRRALIAFKERGHHELAGPLGAAVAAGIARLPAELAPVELLPASPAAVWIVPVPSRAVAVVRRGGDHVRRLAASAAGTLAANGTPAAVAPALRLAVGVRDSVGLGPAARAANLAGRVRFRAAGRPPRGAGVVLLDDVVTTTATVAECSAVLASAGIRVDAAMVVASAAPLLHPGGLRDRSVTVGRCSRTTVARPTS